MRDLMATRRDHPISCSLRNCRIHVLELPARRNGAVTCSSSSSRTGPPASSVTSVGLAGVSLVELIG
jgi:hypothetical protein